MFPIHRSVPNLIVQAIPCQVCTELVKLDRMDLIGHMENKHMQLSPYYCATCLRGMESSREAIRHYHTCHPSERRVKVIDSSYHYDRQIRTLVTSCFPTIAEDIRLPVVFTTCRQCNRKVRNTSETLNKHMFKHARAYYTEMHPFGIGQANEEDFINDLVALFSGNDGQLYRMFILDACFPGAATDDSINLTSVRELIAPRMTRPVDGIGQSDYEQEIILEYTNPTPNPRMNQNNHGQREQPVAAPLVQAPQEVENDDSEDEVDDEFVRNHFRVPNVCEGNESPEVVETVNGYFD